MIDTYLFASLLKGIGHNITLVLVGDSNQLPSVGPGQLLKDLIDEWLSLLNAGFDELTSLNIVKNSSYNRLVKTVLESILLEI